MVWLPGNWPALPHFEISLLHVPRTSALAALRTTRRQPGRKGRKPVGTARSHYQVTKIGVTFDRETCMTSPLLTASPLLDSTTVAVVTLSTAASIALQGKR